MLGKLFERILYGSKEICVRQKEMDQVHQEMMQVFIVNNAIFSSQSQYWLTF